MPRARAVNVKDVLPPALLKVVAQDGFEAITVDAVARAAGVSGAAARAVVPDVYALLGLTVAWVGDQAAPVPPGGSPKDQAFERIMARIDVLQKYRTGFAPLIRGVCADPRALVCVAGRVFSALGPGPVGPGFGQKQMVDHLLLSIIYVCVLRIWMNDESQDLGKTMAELDHRLAQFDRLASWCGSQF
jgi:AcrR family transcriptional regulator